MIINFALTLTYSGIDLLQRTDGGWRRVGAASLLSADLAADLADLRIKGEALAPEGLRTKLVIPIEQVKYLAIDTTRTTNADILETVDGTTPYALDELVIDHERSGGRTHIAAVAKETLQEAEVFARAHGFNPVSFVAVPEAFTFQQEIFFGPTSCAADFIGPDVTLSRDKSPVMLVGTRIKSHLLREEDIPAPVVVKNDTAFIMDPIIAEHHPSEVKAADTAPVVVAVPQAGVLIDPVIAEYHPVPAQTEVPMIAVAAAGLPRPVVLGGVMAPTTPPPAMPRPYLVPSAIAAGIALMGVALWSLYAPDGSDAPMPQTELTAAVVETPVLDSAAEIMLPDTASVVVADPVLIDDTAAMQQLSPPSDPATEVSSGIASLDADQGADRTGVPTLPGADVLATDLGFVAPTIPSLDELQQDQAVVPDVAAETAGADTTTVDAEVSPAENDDAGTDLAEVVVDDSAVTILETRPSVVPRPRPETLGPPEVAEEAEDATAGAVSLAGLQPGNEAEATTDDLAPPPGAIRPRLRPDLPEVAVNPDEVTAVLGGIALAEPEDIVDASAQAVASSLRPQSRPNNFDRVIADARSRQQPAPQAEPEPAAVAAVAPPAAAAPAPPPPPAPPAQAAAPVAPQNYAPVPGGVARAATQDNVIRLRDVNLIGVYGQANARRALVRLGNGQYIRVQVGSELNGGQVTAIGENALNYVVRGTTYALQIPQG